MFFAICIISMVYLVATPDVHIISELTRLDIAAIFGMLIGMVGFIVEE